jgi:hypothetical protein
MPSTSDSPRSITASKTLSVAAVAAAASAGTPAISSISGTLTDGSSITLAGSNFGAKTQAAPLEFQRFAGTNGVAVEVEIPAWPGYAENDLAGGHSGSIFSNTRSHSGSTSAMNRQPDMGHFATNYHKYTATDNVFVSYWVYVEMEADDEYRDSSATTQLKLLRVTSDTDAGGGGVYNSAGTSSGGTWVWSTIFAYTATETSSGLLSGPLDVDAGATNPMATSGYTSSNGNSRYVEMPINQWTRIDMWVQNSSAAGEADGVFGFNAVGVSGNTNLSFENLITVETGKTHQQNAVILGNMVANFVSEYGNDLAIFSDDVYIDNTRSKVEIGDNSDYYSCTRLDICPATSWANDSITVTLNADAVPSGTNYLFAMNNDGTPSAGYEVTI